MSTLDANELHAAIRSTIPNISPDTHVFACIGTDRSTGDSLGPLVGTLLSERFPSLKVFGTIDSPLHALNLSETLEEIMATGKQVIAIDASLGQVNSIGRFQVAKGPLQPGEGIPDRAQKLPEIGDYRITGIVNVGGFMEYFVLQNTRLSLVLRMAKEIAGTIEQCITENIENSCIQTA